MGFGGHIAPNLCALIVSNSKAGIFFLHFRKNSRRKKPKFFGLRPKTQTLIFQKPYLLEILST